jgi:hypothetical protein
MGDSASPDPQHRYGAKPFDTATGYSGLDDHVERVREEARRDPSGDVVGNADTAPQPDDGDMPPDNGRRASVHPVTERSTAPAPERAAVIPARISTTIRRAEADTPRPVPR